jgi:hypothetical protein
MSMTFGQSLGGCAVGEVAAAGVAEKGAEAAPRVRLLFSMWQPPAVAGAGAGALAEAARSGNATRCLLIRCGCAQTHHCASSALNIGSTAAEGNAKQRNSEQGDRSVPALRDFLQPCAAVCTYCLKNLNVE